MYDFVIFFYFCLLRLILVPQKGEVKVCKNDKFNLIGGHKQIILRTKEKV